MKKIWLTLLIVLTFAGGALAQGGDSADPYAHVDSDAEGQALLSDVRTRLLALYGLSLSQPVVLHLADGPAMDALMASSPYKGAEIGLHRMGRDGIHHIYVLKGESRDTAGGILAHEYTHAWQSERCPRRQEQALIEGFAMWVQCKYLQNVGAYASARNITERMADVVYGVGLKAMLAWEDEIGDRALVQRVQQVSALSEGAKP